MLLQMLKSVKWICVSDADLIAQFSSIFPDPLLTPTSSHPFKTSRNLVHLLSVSAANFSPSYLRLNSKGTVPTLVVPLANTTSSEVDTKYKAICDTKGILEFLGK